MLRGYGKSLGDYAAVIVVLDLDDRNCVDFKKELPKVLDACDPGPTILFRTAIKESEAWVLGDCAAGESRLSPCEGRYIKSGRPEED